MNEQQLLQLELGLKSARFIIDDGFKKFGLKGTENPVAHQQSVPIVFFQDHLLLLTTACLPLGEKLNSQQYVDRMIVLYQKLSPLSLNIWQAHNVDENLPKIPYFCIPIPLNDNTDNIIKQICDISQEQNQLVLFTIQYYNEMNQFMRKIIPLHSAIESLAGEHLIVWNLPSFIKADEIEECKMLWNKARLVFDFNSQHFDFYGDETGDMIDDLKVFEDHSFIAITGHNPMNKTLKKAVNDKKNEKLRELLDFYHLEYFDCHSCDFENKYREDGFIIVCKNEDFANVSTILLEIGRYLSQAALYVVSNDNGEIVRGILPCWDQLQQLADVQKGRMF
eukprot:TRINITY_DN9726_c0_g1_i1.p1 TRINITY_DN9726_c0_g1~~TRINITY_DN9726_c0_g1_i1.p1  ORF type:complete len:336 (+),score=78.38 TRINITY_DN9726_c0_g1_i1:25-1032(+)